VHLKRLRASRLDNSHDVEMRKLLRVDLLIIDDFALQALDALDTADIYELIVERHRAAATVATSNREPIEWLGMMADPLLAHSAITGFSPPPTSSCSTASPTGSAKSPPSPRPTTTPLTSRRPPRDHPLADADTPGTRSHVTGARVVPSSWRTTPKVGPSAPHHHRQRSSWPCTERR
jgi:IstB-like ATP binding protein